jgi:hypothetical protein
LYQQIDGRKVQNASQASQGNDAAAWLATCTLFPAAATRFVVKVLQSTLCIYKPNSVHTKQP